MAYGNTQDRPGTPHREDSNPTKPARKAHEPNRDPLIADSDPQGNRITTNYPMKTSTAPPHNSGGPEIRGQHLRGYVHNDSGRKVGNMKSGNDASGTISSTIHDISGPARKSGPPKPDGKTGGGTQKGD
jgi:hypothetical protein